jgi:PKD repeat protein
VHLSGTASGVNFGSSALNITSTTTTVTAKNNIFSNTTIPTGVGLAVGHRRASTTITSYTAGSNRNLFYAGTPSSKKLIYFDGTNRDSTFAQYQVRMTTREANSFSENIAPAFISTTYGNTGFLKFAAGTTTRCESGGEVIAGITTDFEGEPRQGSAGYTGTGSAPDVGADEFEGIPAQQIIVSATPILCNSGTAQVTVTATGGSAPYQGVGTFTRSAGTYTFTVTDASGYSVSKTITIQQPTVLSASATAPAILCNGGTVTVAVSATGGTAPYTGTGSFTVTAGTYNYTVTDANGCTANTTITLTQPGALAAIATVSGILCMGSSTTITAAMQGGSTPYQYAWSNGSGGATTTVYSTATYTVTATDNFGCTATATAAAAALPTPVAVISGDVTVCQGFSTMVSASGGVSYIWSNSLTDVDIWISNGIYTVTVTGSNSCTASASTAITTLPIMSLATTVTPTCGNSSNGTIAVAVSGGAVPFAYNWNTGASTNNISSLAAGTYSVTVTDNNGCMKIVRRTVVVSPIPIAAISGTGVGCVSVALTASGGNSYLWSGGNTPAMSANTFTTSGIYTVTASTAVGCTATASTSLTITESATPSIAITGNGCSNLTLIATGGTYYTWSNGISGATNIVTTSGVYTVTVTNAAGCTGSITQNIVLSSPPLVTITGNTTACQGATALVQASGGISYLWSNNQTTASLSLSFGTYTVTATDTNNCTATASVIITALQPPITTISISGTTCPKTLTASGGTCLWNTGSTTNTIIASNSGIYTVTTTNSVGCTTTASVTIDCCNLQITELRNIIYIHAQAVTFPTPTVTGCATGSILTYLWEFGDGTNSILANPVHTYTNIGVYNVCLTITCTKSDGTYCRAKCYREVSIGKNSPILYPMFAINSVPATGLGYTFTGTPQSVNVVPAPVSTYEVYNSTNTLAGTVTGTNATYTFPNSGEYTVCRKLNYTADANYGTVGTNENCRKMTIVPIAGCNAIVRFTATTYKGNPLNLTFNASSYSSGVNSFYWEYSTSPAGTFIDLGSTINANSPTPTFVFPSAGIYWIRLTANKGTTCETKVSIPIRLNSFTCTTCTNLGINEMRYITYSYVPTVVFPSPTISSPANSSLSYLWEFGDGTMSALVNPTHTYANAGVYNVCLTVTASMPDGSSCFTKCCRDVNIAKSYPALYPTFSFSMPTTGFTHTFTGTIQSTSVIPAPVSTYEIYNSTNTLVTTVTGTNATYTFPNSGEYTVCRNLAYTADANYGAYCTGKNCRKITVMPTTGCNATAKFVATTYKANALNVTFNASSYSTGATAYYWEYSTSPTGTFTQLGTAANSILGTPVFLFPSAGIYWVRLTINKGTACETAIIARINLNAFTCTASSSTTPTVARTVNPDGTIEVGNSDINDGIGLYPNPTDSNVTITFGNDIKATTLIRVYDMKGQLITSFRTQEGDSQTVIDLSSQAAGMYLFHIENENGERLVKKVMKQ